MDVRLDQRTCIITGGSEGIGRSIALATAAAGARVAIFSRDKKDMEEVVSTIRSRGGDAAWFEVDVTHEKEIEVGVEQVLKRWGTIDCIVANAGTNGKWAPIETLTLDDWESTLRINLTGTYLTIRAAVPHMKQQKRGSICIISSVNGTRVFSNQGASAYASSKAGQYALGKMLALELAPFGIRVNVLCPGAIDTGIHEKTKRESLEEIETPANFPEGRIPLTHGSMPNADAVADVALFLLSDRASHVTGTPVWIDGAESLLQG